MVGAVRLARLPVPGFDKCSGRFGKSWLARLESVCQGAHHPHSTNHIQFVGVEKRLRFQRRRLLAAPEPVRADAVLHSLNFLGMPPQLLQDRARKLG